MTCVQTAIIQRSGYKYYLNKTKDKVMFQEMYHKTSNYWTLSCREK